MATGILPRDETNTSRPQKPAYTNVSDVPRSLRSWVSTIQTVVLTADDFQLFIKCFRNKVVKIPWPYRGSYFVQKENTVIRFAVVWYFLWRFCHCCSLVTLLWLIHRDSRNLRGIDLKKALFFFSWFQRGTDREEFFFFCFFFFMVLL